MNKAVKILPRADLNAAVAHRHVGGHVGNAGLIVVAPAADDTGAAAAQVRQASGQLAEQSESMKSAVHTFLKSVKAA